MPLISKIKTLIEYAKFGMSMSKWYRNKTPDIYLPNCFTSFGWELAFNNKKLCDIAVSVEAPYVTSIWGNGYFSNNTNLTKVVLPNCISLSKANQMFDGAKALKEVNLSSFGVLGSNLFRNCTALEMLKLGVVTSCPQYTFQGCTALHTIEIGEGTACDLYFHYCTNLTQECLHNIIDNLADRTGLTALTLQIGSDNIAKLSEEYITKLMSRNWKLL